MTHTVGHWFITTMCPRRFTCWPTACPSLQRACIVASLALRLKVRRKLKVFFHIHMAPQVGQNFFFMKILQYSEAVHFMNAIRRFKFWTVMEDVVRSLHLAVPNLDAKLPGIVLVVDLLAVEPIIWLEKCCITSHCNIFWQGFIFSWRG